MKSPSLDSHDMSLESKLYIHTFQGEWEEVEKLYETKREVWIAEITSSGDTALHMAINEDKEDVVVRLVDIIVEAVEGGRGLQVDHREKAEALRKANEVGDTPLHRAAARGSVKMCNGIVDAATKMSVDLLRIANEWGETPLFVAALYDRKHAFIYLFLEAHYIHGQKVDLLTSSFNGDTVLHSAIRREHFDLAFHILQLCPDLVRRYNVKGMTPLHILASKPSAFRSGYHLSWWQAIIYYCIRVDELKYDGDRRTTDQTGNSEFDVPKNYLTCSQFLSSSYQFLSGQKVKRDPENQSRVEGNVPQNWDTCFRFLFMVLQNLFGLLGFGKAFDEIIEARRKHVWSVQILDQLMKDPGKTYMTKGGSDPGPSFLSDFEVLTESAERLFKTLKTENNKGDKNKEDGHEAPIRRTDTALLVAAQKGVVEVVNKILQRLPVSIHDTSSMKKNIVMIAVENRQPRILEALYTHLSVNLKKHLLWRDLLLAVDTEDNTILHLAAKYGQSGGSHPWQIHGSAMQMQWEIKWYEYVKVYAPTHFVFLTNKNDETPEQIFTRDHEKLVQSSSEWLKDTSESCSVVAALVAGVSFATSSQVPGGTDDETGKPRLEGQPAFELFAVTGLIGLCFSVTALVMFLSILTSRKQPKDFRRNLPLKLLLGLSSLFVSIASMLISFCAAHFFVLEDKFKKGVFPLYAATCLPVSFYAIAQFPLYMDLLKSIVRSVPQSHHFGNL
ncbi:hypothetical protein K1719_009699 [Acacia pycnantha]|nr:hypothetical protein K1719_009699 [Acacia pycnantha]